MSMKLSIISDQISDSFEEAFNTAKEYGFSYVELHNAWDKTIEELDETETATLRKLLKDHGLSVSNIASTVFFVCPLYESDEVSGFDESFHVIHGTIEDHLMALKRACEIACELESPNIRLFPFRFPNNRKPPFGDTDDFQKIQEAIIQASDIAKPYGVTLAIENCPYSHMPKGEMTLELVRAVNRSNVRLLYDPANSYRAVRKNVPERYLSKTLEEEAIMMAPYIAHVHLKNYHYDPAVSPKPFLHVPAGNGDIPLEKLVGLLTKNGCEAALSLEPEVDREGTLASRKWMMDQFS